MRVNERNERGRSNRKRRNLGRRAKENEIKQNTGFREK